MWERESAQRNCIDYGKLRGYPADTEPEHEHGKKTKRLILKQNTKTDADILAERFYKHSALAMGVVGFDDPAVAELNDTGSISRGRWSAATVFFLRGLSFDALQHDPFSTLLIAVLEKERHRDVVRVDEAHL